MGLLLYYSLKVPILFILAILFILKITPKL